MVKNVGLKTVTVSHVQPKTATMSYGNGTVTGQNQKKYCNFYVAKRVEKF